VGPERCRQLGAVCTRNTWACLTLPHAALPATAPKLPRSRTGGDSVQFADKRTHSLFCRIVVFGCLQPSCRIRRRRRVGQGVQRCRRRHPGGSCRPAPATGICCGTNALPPTYLRVAPVKPAALLSLSARCCAPCCFSCHGLAHRRSPEQSVGRKH